MNKNVINTIKLASLPIALFLIFSIFAKGFGVHSIPIIVSQSVIPVITGLGLGILMNAGLMDFSMGARAVFGALVGGMLAQEYGVWGLLLGCALGAMFAAFVMALLYYVLKIPAMVISLGIVLIFEVLGAKIASSSGYLTITKSEYIIGSYPNNTIIMLAAVAIAYIIYYKMQIGNHVIAVGNDEKMCKNLGINASKVKFIAILLTGIFSAFAALLYICYSGSITVATEMSTMSMVSRPIMCVVLGRYMRKYLDCMPLLILIGGLSISIIFNGFIAMGFSENIQDIVLGVFLILILGSESITEIFSQKKRKVVA